MNTRFTIEQLERMKTHDIAELLSNVVLLLRRLPNIECRQLMQVASEAAAAEEPAQAERAPRFITLTPEELKGKKVDELKQIARDLELPIPSRIKKDELIRKLLSRRGQTHSEQYAIQDVK
ncbi:MAG: Rho termination factor N-terminal domain-containing protein [Ktedonobacteraceae bacterium]|nr:Rho termination factor N-terminal domain-containing protein [Ktedonobacteraceae bacterium]